MAYDEHLANRIRELIAGDPDVAEQRMFGGLAFLIGGNAEPHARPFEMRGRQMQGWLRVDDDGVQTREQLEPWVGRGVAYARSLPPKR